MTRARRDFPGASSYVDRHGVRRWRFRARGFSAELGRHYGSEEFCQRYDAAVAGLKARPGVGATRTKPRSVAALVASWKVSPQVMGWAANTKRAYVPIAERFRERHGDKPVAALETRHVQRLMAELAERPASANRLRKVLGMLWDHAVELDWVQNNPARRAKTYRVKSEGFRTWDEADVAKYFATHRPGTLAHTAMCLMLFTGAARRDAVALGWQNVRDGRLRYRRAKTGTAVDITVHPALAAVLEALPRDRLTFLETRGGAARSPSGLGNAMRRWCDAAGLPGCSSHGLRKAMARRLAEAGASEHELMAVGGWKTPSELRVYTAAYGRAGAADAAFEKLALAPDGQRIVTNLSGRFTKREENHD